MKKKRTFFFIAVSVMIILTFSVKSAYSRPDSTVQSEALKFLKQVAGISTNEVSLISFNVSTPKMLDSETPQTVISAKISYDNTNYSLAMIFVEGKVYFYSLYPLSAISKDVQVTENSCLTLARRAINEYETCFSANHVNGFAEMIPTKLQTRDITVNSGSKRLNISYTDDSTNKTEYAKFRWVKMVDGYAIPHMSTTIIISKMGVVSSFIDNLALYKVPTTKVTVSKEDAIAIAMPYFEAYALDSKQTLKTVEATFQYGVDSASSRGDNHLIYPQWRTFAEFDGPNENSTKLYGVMLWADTGEVYHHGLQGHYQLFPAGTTTSPITLTIVAFAVVVSFSGVVLLLRRHSKQRKSKVNTFLLISSLLTIVTLLSSLYIPLGSAAEISIALGSRDGVPQEEIDADNYLCTILDYYSYIKGILSHNYYGSDTTAGHVYDAANGDGLSRSSVFHIGHGRQIDVLHSITIPPWFFHFHHHVAFRLDSGSYVKDDDIYWNSDGSNGQRLVVLWTCHQAEDAMGTLTWCDSPICQRYYEYGMPRAWFHQDYLSFDGYNNPYSANPPKCFISFTGVGPYLTNDELGYDDAGNVFIHHFYYGLMMCGWHARDSLDFAADSVWGVNYGSCMFHTGYTLYAGGGQREYGQMDVYGNSLQYFPY